VEGGPKDLNSMMDRVCFCRRTVVFQQPNILDGSDPRRPYNPRCHPQRQDLRFESPGHKSERSFAMFSFQFLQIENEIVRKSRCPTTTRRARG
jgi:hypothetical protein